MSSTRPRNTSSTAVFKSIEPQNTSSTGSIHSIEPRNTASMAVSASTRPELLGVPAIHAVLKPEILRVLEVPRVFFPRNTLLYSQVLGASVQCFDRIKQKGNKKRTQQHSTRKAASKLLFRARSRGDSFLPSFFQLADLLPSARPLLVHTHE